MREPFSDWTNWRAGKAFPPLEPLHALPARLGRAEKILAEWAKNRVAGGFGLKIA